ncbi:MAG: coniferyl aldehyde dehydrogenase [Polyangiaceae bacterium]|nr:coniferyl aldehyde dehydrogenase [Polyangiaceae bacterium]
MNAAATTTASPPPGTAAITELPAILARMKEAARKRGVATCEQRVAALDRLAHAVLTRKDAIVRAASSDFGNRSKHETLAVDVFGVLSGIQYAKSHVRDWMEAEDRETSWISLPSVSQVTYQPLGVIGIISPWNYPVALALGPLVAALAAGNGAMLKPSELVPETSAVLADLVAEAFAPDHVTLIRGGVDVGAAFAALPFDHIVFTGSPRVGKLVMQAASENLVPVTLELGGKCPAIVGPDFNARKAAARVMAAKTLNAGQTCLAPDYVLVPRSVRETFADGCRAAVAKMYPTIQSNSDYTSIISDSHAARIRGLVDDARSRGGRVVELGPPSETAGTTRKIAPVLVVEPTESMACMQEEIFGPLLPIVTYDKLDDAVAFVNARPRPLALYYFGFDRASVDRVLAHTVSGGVTVNEAMLHYIQDDLPFGGVGQSGMGHYHGKEGFVTMSAKKAVFRQSVVSARRLLAPPYGKLADGLLRLLLGA